MKEEIRAGLQSLLAAISKHDESLNSSTTACDENQASLSVSHAIFDEEGSLMQDDSQEDNSPECKSEDFQGVYFIM